VSAHTPGPWKFHELHNSSLDFFAGSTVLMCGVRIIANYEANARLIVAAPDLLIALEAVMHDCDDLDMVPSNEPGRKTSAFELACAAIAKARGAS
jgi:hypothetical protein